jgi:hypothetical protein
LSAHRDRSYGVLKLDYRAVRGALGSHAAAHEIRVFPPREPDAEVLDPNRVQPDTYSSAAFHLDRE